MNKAEWITKKKRLHDLASDVKDELMPIMNNDHACEVMKLINEILRILEDE